MDCYCQSSRRKNRLKERIKRRIWERRRLGDQTGSLRLEGENAERAQQGGSGSRNNANSQTGGSEQGIGGSENKRHYSALRNC